MPELAPAYAVTSAPPPQTAGVVRLGYDARLIRRKRLETMAGDSFLVDLPEVTNLDAHWGLLLADGRGVKVQADDEPVLVVTGPELARYAWHIGNRHTPCQIEPTRLVIRADHVLQAMLAGLGARVEPHLAPFRPELGAYGTGRTMGHSHGDHGHDQPPFAALLR